MAYLEHQIQHFKPKEYYKASNDKRSINTSQEKFVILEEMMEAECEDEGNNVNFLGEELA